MTGGQKDPDIAEALTAVFAADYTIYCVPWAVQAPLAALREHLDNVSGPLEQRGAIRRLRFHGYAVSRNHACGPA